MEVRAIETTYSDSDPPTDCTYVGTENDPAGVLARAYATARSARFEHGERGALR